MPAAPLNPLPHRGRGQGEGAATAPAPAIARAAAPPLAKYDPNEPRVPAGNPEGGEWTSDGSAGDELTGSSTPSRAPGPGAGESDPRRLGGDRVWERFPNPDFRNKLAIAEGSANKPNFGYGEANRRSGALGRYQMKPNALHAAGMIDGQGKWTGKYGIHSAGQFLASPEAQEKALTDYLDDAERQLRANGSFNYIGTTISGRVAPFTVTRAGLIAAGHHEGARATRAYLTNVQNSGFASAQAKLTDRGLHVETRLRTFADAPYE